MPSTNRPLHQAPVCTDRHSDGCATFAPGTGVHRSTLRRLLVHACAACAACAWHGRILGHIDGAVSSADDSAARALLQISSGPRALRCSRSHSGLSHILRCTLIETHRLAAVHTVAWLAVVGISRRADCSPSFPASTLASIWLLPQASTSTQHKLQSPRPWSVPARCSRRHTLGDADVGLTPVVPDPTFTPGTDVHRWTLRRSRSPRLYSLRSLRMARTYSRPHRCCSGRRRRFRCSRPS